MEPFDPGNRREEGPPGGIFSGPSGEFTIYRGGREVPQGEESKPGRDAEKN